jgi:two-component system phosphate regulon response regulator OmpR
MSGRVLIIDDDERLARMLGDYLGAAGLEVVARSTGVAGLASAADCDVVVLDLGLPDMDGLEVCRRLRERSATPILMLTARGEDTDRIVGLELGADDYLGKPFNPRELLARLRVILRRAGEGSGPAILRFGRLEIDPGSRSVRLDGASCAVTSAQFDLLLVLARHAGRVLSRERLMDLARGAELEAFDRSIDVHISRLRAVLEDEPARPRRILTVRGAGYVFARAQD